MSSFYCDFCELDFFSFLNDLILSLLNMKGQAQQHIFAMWMQSHRGALQMWDSCACNPVWSMMPHARMHSDISCLQIPCRASIESLTTGQEKRKINTKKPKVIICNMHATERVLKKQICCFIETLVCCKESEAVAWLTPKLLEEIVFIYMMSVCRNVYILHLYFLIYNFFLFFSLLISLH